MSAQLFTQAAVVFLAGVTCMNIIANFILLWVEERKKCSIIHREKQKRKSFLLAGNRQKKYAVLRMAEKTA